MPLTRDSDGVMRVANTRITLDSIILAFLDGATAEEIAAQYPSLALADIYAVITYYLHRRQEVDAYLQKRDAVAANAKRENEDRFDPAGVRARLLNRRKELRTN
jgi:uncharacterized protein (DUF433 family)